MYAMQIYSVDGGVRGSQGVLFYHSGACTVSLYKHSFLQSPCACAWLSEQHSLNWRDELAVSDTTRYCCHAGKFFWFLLFMMLTLMYFTFYGIVCVAITASLLAAAVVSNSLYVLMGDLFSGFIIPQPVSPLLLFLRSFLPQ